MTIRRVALAFSSFVLGVVLVIVLIRLGSVDVHSTVEQLRNIPGIAFVKVALLEVLLIVLSTEKWRSVDAALRHSSDGVPSKLTAFGVTSAGMALGLVVPVQIGMAGARTLGTYFYGRPLQRGTAGSLFEQSFDLLVASLLAMASAVTWFTHAEPIIWVMVALVMMAIGLLAMGPFLRLLRWAAKNVRLRLANKQASEFQIRTLAQLENSAVFGAGLARRLLLLSAVRFVVVVLIAWQTAEAMNAHIPLWQMAIVTPFVLLANVLALTPGGIGLNEATSVSALRVLGTPLSLAVQWSLVNRALVTVCCFAVALATLSVMTLRKLIPNGVPQKKACEGNTQNVG